jgi:oxygen-independent coproporphyrinogen-3 oxidase
MSGIYIHIPFCKKKCNYCDFYSTKDSNGIDALVKSEIKELKLRQDYLLNESIKTIYFGGGTPSLLGICHIFEFLNVVRSVFNVTNDCEITLEANPEDLTDEYLIELFNIGINRLSIGIQSFNNEVLKFLGRRHNNSKIKHIIEFAQKIGFNNISVDLIFGIPSFDLSTYLDSLNEVLKLNVQHISAYALTFAEGTLFHKRLTNRMINEINEEDMLNQFNATIDTLADNGFFQYEVSNYAKQGFESKHNTSYWENVKYIGIGPSAHSYNLVSRQWNMSHTAKYCRAVEQSESFFEIEYLSQKDKYNDYIITGLRTFKGVSLVVINERYEKNISTHFLDEVNKLLNDDLLYVKENRIVLTRKGVFVSDFIIEKLFIA